MINLSMPEPDNILRPRIAVMGVGGAGGNAINNMINSQLIGCDFMVANTDSQALAMSLAPRKLQLGINLSRGLGAGSKPEIGRAAAEEQLADILACLEGSDMLFVTAGMGGGTGTGAAPVIARAARESGILTVGVVTKPFHFEGNQRMRQSEMGISELQQYVDTLIVIPNQNLFRIANERTTFAEAFRLADEVLYAGVRGITDLMVMPGFMNLDFADVKTVMQEMGKAMMGTGEADGDNRAIRAAEAAISNPLLDDISMKGARGVLINITGGMDMTLFEVDQAANRIRDEVDPDAQIKVGSTLGEDMQGKIRVSVIATGIDAALAEQQRQRAAAAAGSASGGGRAPQASIRNIETAPRITPTTTVAPAQPAAQAVQPTVTTSQLNVSNPYFTMPQTVTPQMLAQQQTAQAQAQAVETLAAFEEEFVEETAEEQAAIAKSAATRHAEMLLATQAAASPAQQYQTRPATPVTAPTYASPVKSAAAPTTAQASPRPTASQPSPAAEPVGNGDIRITQLTARTSSAGATAQPNGGMAAPAAQRSQSLFQRITGFGIARPSAQEEDEMEAEQETASPKATQSRLSVDQSDRPVASTAQSQQADLLEIPTFLRRQSNH